MAYVGSVIRLPVGVLGFSGSRNPTQLQAGHFEEVDNVTLEGGLIQKMGGKIRFVTAAQGFAINSGISYYPTAGVERQAVFGGDGDIYKFNPGTGDFDISMATGLNVTRDPPPYFMMAGGEAGGSPRTLFVFSSVNQVRAVDGDGVVMAAITTPPADWAGAGNFPTFGVLHEGRLWGGGNANDPHRMYYSRATDHQDFSSPGGTLSIFPGRGEKLVGAVSFKGLLMLWKYPRGVYAVNTQDPSPAGWRVEELSSAVGGVSQHLILPIDNDTLYMDPGGNIHLLSATNAFGGVQTSNISQRSDLAEYMRSQIDLTKLIRCMSVWYGTKQQAWFSLKQLSESDVNSRLIIDFSSPEIGPRFLKSSRDQINSMWMRQDTVGVLKPMIGTADEFVHMMDRDARNNDGDPYTMLFSTANTDFSFADPILATKNKNGDFLELIFEPQGDWDLTVQIFWDDVPGPPMLFSMGGVGAPLGSFILDTDVLSSLAIKNIRKRMAGSGRRFRLEAMQAGEDQNVAISDFFVSFRAADEKSRE